MPRTAAAAAAAPLVPEPTRGVRKSMSKSKSKKFDDEDDVEFALNQGVCTYDSGAWLADEKQLKLGDKGLRAWRVTAFARDPRDAEEWISLYDHVSLSLADGLDSAQTPMCWAEDDVYGEEQREAIDAELLWIARAVRKVADTHTEEVLLETEHVVLKAAPVTCRVVLSLA